MNNHIVVGLLFGDEGKGTTVDYLAYRNQPTQIVRFSGGAQTAHNVIHPIGIHHTFAQFGSATLQEIPTTLSKYMLVDPLNLLKEADILYAKTSWNPFPDLMISENSPLTTPYHKWLNRKREEKRTGNAHGSCGLGIGETRLHALKHPEHALTMSDLKNTSLLTQKLKHLHQYVEQEANQKCPLLVETIIEQYTQIMDENFLNIVPDIHILDRINSGYTIFEGSQGVLLDEAYGFHPHTTWTSTVPENAQKLLQEAGQPKGEVVGTIRTYMTRHGYGPFPSEILNTPKTTQQYPELHNKKGKWMGEWRRGHLDLPLLQYALQASRGVDFLSVTHVDKISPETKIVTAYNDLNTIPKDKYSKLSADDYQTPRDEQEQYTHFLNNLTIDNATLTTTPTMKEFTETLKTVTDAPLKIRSYGPTYNHKKWG